MITYTDKITAFTDNDGLSSVKLEGLENFLIAQIFDCGQCFRFDPVGEDSFEGVAYGRYVRFSQSAPNVLEIHNSTVEDYENIWRHYLALDADYSAIRAEIASRFKTASHGKDKIMPAAMEYGSGIRILRQESWETVCSFIISQNNNIPRIKGIVERLCECFGEKISDTAYSFPTAEVIAKLTVEDLAPLRAGFRAKYILDAAKKVSSGEIDLSKIEKMSLEEADKLLRTICGVGPKVSACILLFGFHKIDAFPIDVWINRALDYYYNDGFPERFKKYGGIAQQYIFHYIRTCDTAIPDEYRKK